MNDFPALFAAALERPDDPEVRMILADWLEENGDPANQARADLIRLQIEYEATLDRSLHQKAAEILKAHRQLLAPLRPIFRQKVRPLELNPSLLVVLGAGVQTIAGGIEAGSVWVGHLFQGENAFPTTMTIRKREGNAIQGDMEQDFESMVPGWRGKFYFRGVVASRFLFTFATYKLEGQAAGPGLYQLALGSRGKLEGTWWVPPGEYRDRMALSLRTETTSGVRV